MIIFPLFASLAYSLSFSSPPSLSRFFAAQMISYAEKQIFYQEDAIVQQNLKSKTLYLKDRDVSLDMCTLYNCI